MDSYVGSCFWGYAAPHGRAEEKGHIVGRIVDLG